MGEGPCSAAAGKTGQKYNVNERRCAEKKGKLGRAGSDDVALSGPVSAPASRGGPTTVDRGEGAYLPRRCTTVNLSISRGVRVRAFARAFKVHWPAKVVAPLPSPAWLLAIQDVRPPAARVPTTRDETESATRGAAMAAKVKVC